MKHLSTDLNDVKTPKQPKRQQNADLSPIQIVKQESLASVEAKNPLVDSIENESRNREMNRVQIRFETTIKSDSR